MVRHLESGRDDQDGPKHESVGNPGEIIAVLDCDTEDGMGGCPVFSRSFKQSFGRPPHRYHTGRRIERAKALLAQPAQSVTEIGFTVGFSEASSFTAAFRRETGLTPSSYRRSLV
jgi:methylphosphotriester-DNA--protein-cysteine methyltransferase